MCGKSVFPPYKKECLVVFFLLDRLRKHGVGSRCSLGRSRTHRLIWLEHLHTGHQNNTTSFSVEGLQCRL